MPTSSPTSEPLIPIRAGSTLLRPWAAVLGGAVFVAAALAVAWWMTGAAPKPVGAGAPDRPPPLVLRDEVPEKSELAQAAGLLRVDADAAERAFTAIVADSPSAVEPQVGLILSRWHDQGPAAVQRDLRQLERENPQDAYVLLHQGLLSIYLREPAGRTGLQKAQQAAVKAGAFDLARRADDLLHPQLPPGYPPPVARADWAGTPQARRDLRALLVSLGADDRAAASAQARTVLRHRVSDPALAATVAAALYDKDDTAGALVAANEAIALVAEHPVAQLQVALVQLWSGQRAAALTTIERLAASDPAPFGTPAASARAQAIALLPALKKR